MIRTQAREDFCGLPHSPVCVCAPACVHTPVHMYIHTHKRGKVLGTAELMWPPAQVSQQPGVEELGSQAGAAGPTGILTQPLLT